VATVAGNGVMVVSQARWVASPVVAGAGCATAAAPRDCPVPGRGFVARPFVTMRPSAISETGLSNAIRTTKERVTGSVRPSSRVSVAVGTVAMFTAISAAAEVAASRFAVAAALAVIEHVPVPPASVSAPVAASTVQTPVVELA